MTTLSPGSRPRLARKARLRWDRVGQTWMLVYPERGLVLNESASAILRACDGSRTVEAIARDLAATYGGATPEAVGREILSFLERLRTRGLVELAG